ncbi:MAG: hypothetical protein ACK4I8_08145, partial [Armatimonadota bacterium]
MSLLLSRLKPLLQKIQFTGGSCSCTTENFSAHLEVRPPIISASRQIGRLVIGELVIDELVIGELT